MNHRYPHDQTDNISQARAALAAITDRPMLPLPKPSVIKSALTEYRYQSCEHPTYATSAAGELVAQLIATIEQPAAVSPDGGWFEIDTITAPQPAPATPAPEADPMAAARASLMAAFNAPAAMEPIAAPEPQPAPQPTDPLETITTEAKARALAVLLTLGRLANGSADAARFTELANRIGSNIEQAARAEASAEAARNVAAIQAVWNAA